MVSYIGCNNWEQCYESMSIAMAEWLSTAVAIVQSKDN